MPASVSKISIHALLAESDAYGRINDISRLIFLSTLSLRRATVNELTFSGLFRISIHALLAESDQRPSGCRSGGSYFYPRSPCGERLYTAIVCTSYSKFLSTLSLRRATACCPASSSTRQVFLSTLSLRRATSAPAGKRAGRYHFYPRSPCGERQCRLLDTRIYTKFLSTLSLRRATATPRAGR